VDAVAGAGTDVLAYRRATDIAEDARKQFAAVAHDARQERTPRPAPVRPQPVAPRPVAPEPVAPEPVAPPAVQVPEPQSEPVPLPVTETVEAAKPAPVEVVARPIAPVREESVRPQLEAAWRAFAAGDLGGSEEQLTRILAAHSSGEAYLLRGCTRYTRAMLSRKGDLDGAEADFRAALRVNRALRLDPAAFSPKLVTYFERLRTSPASKPLL